MKYYVIYIDGIDKTGKGLIQSYVDRLSGHRFMVKSRGILSMLAYSKLYNRNYTYDLSSQENAVTVLLDVDYDDWLVRCKTTNEPIIDYEAHRYAFERAYDYCKDKIKIIRYDTSNMTPYNIAKEIIKYMEALNNGRN